MSIQLAHSAMAIALAGIVALSGCSKKTQEDPNLADAPAASVPPTPGTVAPVARDQAAQASVAPAANGAALAVTSVTVGTSAAPDKSVVPVSSIASKDAIIVSVKTEGVASNVTVSAKLTYQDGQSAGEQGVSMTTSGNETTNLSFSKPDGWPPGNYTAQVTVDGKPAGNPQAFTVK